MAFEAAGVRPSPKCAGPVGTEAIQKRYAGREGGAVLAECVLHPGNDDPVFQQPRIDSDCMGCSWDRNTLALAGRCPRG